MYPNRLINKLSINSIKPTKLQIQYKECLHCKNLYKHKIKQEKKIFKKILSLMSNLCYSKLDNMKPPKKDKKSKQQDKWSDNKSLMTTL